MSVFCAAHSLDESMPLVSGEAEDDPDVSQDCFGCLGSFVVSYKF